MLILFTPKLSKLVRVCRKYCLPKFGAFFETKYKLTPPILLPRSNHSPNAHCSGAADPFSEKHCCDQLCIAVAIFLFTVYSISVVCLAMNNVLMYLSLLFYFFIFDLTSIVFICNIVINTAADVATFTAYLRPVQNPKEI